MTKTKTLDDGTEISQDNFGRIFGGGRKAELDKVRTIKIGDMQYPFTIRNLADLQAVIDLAISENLRLETENDQLKDRIARLTTLAPVQSSALPVGPRKRGRPRKRPLPETPVSAKPRVRVQATSYRSAA
ncbi:hypothetical protein HJB53_29915 [Rhizobium lentis]|uniref:hypothetical protein n=1 Tax=Rhizobium lentis TaxID=1138194 RepID=UPI001C83658A|nr:hypothetical protein [Rhizobium lentis]MBX5130707.1 hypothetical protein [Rhizobium lentis]